jgi:NADH:ubiquinone oxidoreductase subunit C
MYFTLFFFNQKNLFLKKNYLLFFSEFFYINTLYNANILIIRLIFDILEIVSISITSLIFLLKLLKNSLKFKLNLLLDIIILDFFNKKLRYNIKYFLQSLKFTTRITINLFIEEKTPILSIISCFKNANWYEREIWDMFGIYISNHFDLRRILTDYSFLQFPLRKDFPLSGFFELYYNDSKKKIISTQISFLQEFRFFYLKNIWKSQYIK